MKINWPGRYMVSDAAFSYANPPFRGTRMVAGDVVEQVASGNYWRGGGAGWRPQGALRLPAIASAQARRAGPYRQRLR